MGEKLTPVFEMDFQLPDVGVQVFRIDTATVIKERKDRATGEDKPGWEYKLISVQEGGGADGAKLFDSFFTESKNNFSLKRMFGFLIKVGIYKEDASVDSDQFKTDGFAKNWAKLVNKKFGADIDHKKNLKGNDQATVKKYLTVAEAKGLGNQGTMKVKEEKVSEKQADKADDGWGD